MFLVKSCCGCISLEKGTITIGVLSLIGAILNTVAMTMNVIAIPETKEPQAANIIILLKVFVVSILIYLFIGGIFSALLIVGAVKRRSGYIFPWVAVSFGGVVGGLCVTIAISIISAIELPVGAFFILTAISTASTALQIHLWQVVYSHHKELVAEKYGHQSPPLEGQVKGAMSYHNV